MSPSRRTTLCNPSQRLHVLPVGDRPRLTATPTSRRCPSWIPTCPRRRPPRPVVRDPQHRNDDTTPRSVRTAKRAATRPMLGSSATSRGSWTRPPTPNAADRDHVRRVRRRLRRERVLRRGAEQRSRLPVSPEHQRARPIRPRRRPGRRGAAVALHQARHGPPRALQPLLPLRSVEDIFGVGHLGDARQAQVRPFGADVHRGLIRRARCAGDGVPLAGASAPGPRSASRSASTTAPSAGARTTRRRERRPGQRDAAAATVDLYYPVSERIMADGLPPHSTRRARAPRASLHQWSCTCGDGPTSSSDVRRVPA